MSTSANPTLWAIFAALVVAMLAADLGVFRRASGQEMTFQAADGRIQVKVFASATQSLRFSIRYPIDPASVPPAPSTVVGGLLFQLIAEACDGTPIPVLANDTNPLSGSLSVTAVGSPEHGSATLQPDGTILYTPAANYAGQDEFTYGIASGGIQTQGTVSVEVTNGTEIAASREVKRA